MNKFNRADKIAKILDKFTLPELMDLSSALSEQINARRERGEEEVACLKKEHTTERIVYTKCGKVTCQCSRGEKLHGPYRYQYWREDGRLRSRYLGKPQKS